MGRRSSASRAQERACIGSGGGAWAERTANMLFMFVTLDVSKLSGWLNADACCRVEREAHIRRGARAGRGGGRACGDGGGASSVQAQDPTAEAAGGGTRGAHVKHAVHGCDAGGVPARYVCVEQGQAREELRHVCDCRDVPVSDGAVRRSGGSRVGIVLLGRRFQGGLVREGVGRRRRRRRLWGGGWGRGAVPRTPARAIVSRREGRGARPCATGEKLVGCGQPLCTLPSRTGSMGRGARCGPGRREGVWGRRRKQGAGRGPDCGGCWQGHARSARKTCGTWL